MGDMTQPAEVHLTPTQAPSPAQVEMAATSVATSRFPISEVARRAEASIVSRALRALRARPQPQ